MPTIPLLKNHPDYAELAPLVAAFVEAAGGMAKLSQEVPQLIRKAVDEVIDAPRTNRFTLLDTEKTEKTYLGTKIEILLRAYLRLPKGRILDLSIGGVETDIKDRVPRCGVAGGASPRCSAWAGSVILRVPAG